MGYRSNIRVMTTLEGFDKMQDIIWQLAKKKGVDDANVLFSKQGDTSENCFDYYDAQENYLCFGFDWLKWYDTYVEVELFMEMLQVANEEGVAWQFIRVGEDCSDIEQLASDKFWDNLSTVMYLRVDIVY